MWTKGASSAEAFDAMDTWRERQRADSHAAGQADGRRTCAVDAEVDDAAIHARRYVGLHGHRLPRARGRRAQPGFDRPAARAELLQETTAGDPRVAGGVGGQCARHAA